MSSAPKPLFKLEGWAAAVLIAATLFYGFAAARFQNDWWFEDDPNVLYFTQRHTNPITYFTDREVMLHLSPRRTLTPMQGVSFWLDSLVGNDPFIFYLHCLLVTLLTLWLFYGSLRVYTEAPLALCASLFLLMIPATASVVEFISARHYLEGLTWTLIGWYFLKRYIHRPGNRYGLLIAISCYGAAALSKEIWVTTSAWLYFAYLLHHKKFPAAAAMVVSGILYFIYRGWMIGLVGSGFSDSGSFLSEYPRFLALLPYTLVGHRFGYLLVLGILIYSRFKGFSGSFDSRRLRLWFFWAVHFLVALATVYPVSQHLTASYEETGTWYRVVFALDAVILAWAAISLKDRIPKPGLFVTATVALPFFLMFPIAETWDRLKEPLARDGHFYIENPDKLLLPESPGFFMAGVHNITDPLAQVHFLDPTGSADQALPLLLKFPSLWAFDGESYESNAALHKLVTINAVRGQIPLDQGELPAASTEDESMVGHRGKVDASGFFLERLLYGEVARTWPVAVDPADTRFVYMLPDEAKPAELQLLIKGSAGGTVRVSGRLDKITLDEGGTARVHVPREALGKAVVLEAEEPVMVMALAETTGGLVQLVPAAKTVSGPAYIAHIPDNGQVWQLDLLVFNPTDDAEVLTLKAPLLSEAQTLTVPAKSLLRRRMTPGSEAAVVTGDEALLIQAVLRALNREDMAFFKPADRSTAPLASPDLTRDGSLQNLAMVTNRESKVVLSDAQGRNLSSKQLGNGEKWLLSHPAETTGSITEISGDASVFGLVVTRYPWGHLRVIPFYEANEP